MSCLQLTRHRRRPVRLLDQVRTAIRLRQYSLRTERAYVGWIKRYILFHDKRHPSAMGAPEVTTFLSHLAVAGNVAAATQQQALAALLFLYREVLKVELPWMNEIVRPKKPQKVPTVLSRGEVDRLLAAMEGVHALMARLLYGTGMRLMECMRLRVKDVDFDRGEITVRDGKCGKDCGTMLPAAEHRVPPASGCPTRRSAIAYGSRVNVIGVFRQFIAPRR